MTMINHPNRSRKSVDATIRRMLTRHHLERVTLSCHIVGVRAEAIPNRFHPLVDQRRQAAFEAAGSLTIAEATEVHAQSLKPVSTALGETIEEAVEALLTALSEPPK